MTKQELEARLAQRRAEIGALSARIGLLEQSRVELHTQLARLQGAESEIVEQLREPAPEGTASP